MQKFLGNTTEFQPHTMRYSARNCLETIGFAHLAEKYRVLNDIKKSICLPRAIHADGSLHFAGSAVIGDKSRIFLTAHQTLLMKGEVYCAFRVFFPLQQTGKKFSLLSRRARLQWLWSESRFDLASGKLINAASLIKRSRIEPVKWFPGNSYKGDVLFVGFLCNPIRLHASRGSLEYGRGQFSIEKKLTAKGYVGNGFSGGGVFTPAGECLGVIDSGTTASTDFTPAKTVYVFTRGSEMLAAAYPRKKGARHAVFDFKPGYV